jgi:hypothetical protein
MQYSLFIDQVMKHLPAGAIIKKAILGEQAAMIGATLLQTKPRSYQQHINCYNPTKHNKTNNMQVSFDTPATAQSGATSKPANLFGISLIAALAGFIFGFDTVVISGANEPIKICGIPPPGFMVSLLCQWHCGELWWALFLAAGLRRSWS